MTDWKDDVAVAWELLSVDGEMQWFAKREPHGVMGGRLRTLDALIGTVDNAAHLDWNLFLQLNVSRPHPGRAKLAREDITHWRYVLLDLDPISGPMTQISALVPPEPLACGPEHMLFSGRGYQFWLPVRYGGCWSESAKDSIEQIMREHVRFVAQGLSSWAPGYVLDSSTTDLARVVRCPGSVNQKTGRRASFVRVGDGTLIAPADLDRLPEPPREVVVPMQLTGIRENLSLLDLIPHLNVTAKRFILEGAESPGRHHACFAACKNLHELGVAKVVTEKLLAKGALKCYERTQLIKLPEFDDAEVGEMLNELNTIISPKPLSCSDVTAIVDRVYGGA